MNYWLLAAMFLLGIVAGIAITIKWLAPPGTKIGVGKMKVRGRGNQQESIIDLTGSDLKTGKQRREERRKRLKELREQRRSPK